MTPACFSQHTAGTANAVANVLDCDSRDPVLVEIRSRNKFYGHPFPSAVSIRAAICFMRNCVHSILIFPGTACVDRPIFAHWSILSVQTGESICNYRVFSDIYSFYRHYLLLYHLSKQCRPLSDINSFSISLVSTLYLHCLSYYTIID